MRDLTLAINQNTTVKKRHANPANVLRWNMAILVSILVLGLTYLFQINALGTKGYQIRNLEQKIKELSVEQKVLEVEGSELKSITRIQQEAMARNFVPTQGVNYIKDGDYALR